MKKKTIIGVMGPGAEATESDIIVANELGKKLAENGYYVLSGGVAAGVMQAVTAGAKEGGGTTIGIIPRLESEIAEGIDIPIMTDIGAARNNINAMTADIIVAVGIGSGTMTEICFALSPKCQTEVILLNETPEQKAFLASLNTGLVYSAKSVDDALSQIKKILNS